LTLPVPTATTANRTKARACKARSSSTKLINPFSTLVACDERVRVSDGNDKDDECTHCSTLIRSL